MSLGDHVRATRIFLEAFKRAEFLKGSVNVESNDNELTKHIPPHAQLCHDLKARVHLFRHTSTNGLVR